MCCSITHAHVCVLNDGRSEESSSDDDLDNNHELWFEQRRKIKDSIQAGASAQSAILSSRYHSNTTGVAIGGGALGARAPHRILLNYSK